jgi:Dyp-type peroxidase family
MFNLNRILDLQNLSAADQAMLGDLQVNILKGHGREYVKLLFLSFKAGKQTEARAFVAAMGCLVTSAQKQLEDTAFHKATEHVVPRPITDPVVAFFLTHKGYGALGLGQFSPQDTVYRDGLKARGAVLSDPPVSHWDAELRKEIHAMVLIGGALDDPKKSWTSKQADSKEKIILNLLAKCGLVIHTEKGRAIKNEDGHGLEHFGYVDGRSQPLFIKQDIHKETTVTDPGTSGISHWNPTFNLSRLMVHDGGGTAEHSMGSFFVMRKLEQNVKKFKATEAALQKKLEKKQSPGTLKEEVAGSMIVGRFENGTPITLQDTEIPGGPGVEVKNNFNYDQDPAGLKCPFHAHIRKTNPRGASDAERAPIMARRGITYGKRKLLANGSLNTKDEPSKNVGLLFMAYNVDIAEQFEFTQQSWANNTDFPKGGVGPDPIIGQGNSDPQHNPSRWNQAGCKIEDSHFADCVTMKGGEYFFAPSRSFLQNVS